MDNLLTVLQNNPYPGRGIVMGKTTDGKQAVVVYFIMGRSNNSRNRVFREEGKDLIIHPFDPGKVEDSSLIVYSPLRVYKNHIIVTNGDQTDTVYEGLVQGKKFAEALSTRTFEPDAPNYTPRISGMVTFEKNDFSYQMNILKCADENGISCDRFNFSYAALPGRGHFIHTYVTDGNPLPTFRGEPVCVGIPSDVASFAQNIWNALNPDNIISLYVRAVNSADHTMQNFLFNRNV